MSTLTVSNLQGTSSSNNLINMPSGHSIYSPGGIIQVVQSFMDSTFSTTTTASSGGTVVPALAVTITPKKSSSKILVMAILNCDGTVNVTQVYSWLARGSTKIGVGAAAGSRVTIGGRFYYADNNVSGMIPMTYLDTPSTISPITYNVYIGTETATGSVVLNRTIADTDNTTNGTRSSSTLTVMEIAQ